jgi:SAM-dependent methyltransferase
MDEIRRSWEQRADECNRDIRGVLFRGLSMQSNLLLHEWHAWIVLNVLLPRLPQRSRLLDLGCGYGRLSDVVARVRPDIEIVGQDIASGYCRMFANSHGQCVLASAMQPPFRDGCFDGILGITCLMYIPRASVRDTLASLNMLLRPRGVILMLDPGLEMQQAAASVRGKKAKSPTGGSGFGVIEYRQLLSNAGFTPEAEGGNPFLSSALVIPGLAKAKARWVQTLLGRVAGFDNREAGYTRLALHRWLFGVKHRNAKSGDGELG